MMPNRQWTLEDAAIVREELRRASDQIIERLPAPSLEVCGLIATLMITQAAAVMVAGMTLATGHGAPDQEVLSRLAIDLTKELGTEIAMRLKAPAARGST